MNKIQRAEKESEIRSRYEAVRDGLTERTRRLFVASEANAVGYGGIAIASRATGMARSVIRKGVRELERIESGDAPALDSKRSRLPGGGRKKVEDRYPELLPTLKALVESTTRGDPESPLLWTSRSLRNILVEMKEAGFSFTPPVLSRLLKELGYSLQANKKKLEGKQHPDRDAQFRHIAESVRRQHENDSPAISVDTKKKELVGQYKNAGRELRPVGDPESVDCHDFPGELGKVAPFGVYDLAENEAWVSVGISSDTAQFSVESIRRWWREMGKSRYDAPRSLLVTADAGGSNGYRTRLWKTELQKLANELGIPITVCHFPPGTSKWNKIEHRLFSFITKNWRGKPLYSHQVIVQLIAATTTAAGLTVKCAIDDNPYRTGVRVTDRELAEVRLVPDKFHGEWNYTIVPEGMSLDRFIS